MLYLYDSAVIDDLKRTIDPTGEANPSVIMCTVENYQDIVAQMHEDKITYPLIILIRNDDMSILKQNKNFARSMKGVPAEFDTKTNNIYYERAVPIDLQYTMYILCTNVADRDEIAREIYFKYLSMFYLHIETPYEAKRRIRFGIQLDEDAGINNESGAAEYTQTGAIYQTQLTLKTHGCVWLHYTPRHLQIETMSRDIKIENPKGDK